MKYGYLYWKKPLLKERRERTMNLGDVFQSLGAVHILKSLGIADEDIIPLNRFDLMDYDGEPVVLLMYGVEHECKKRLYNISYYPLPSNIIPVFWGWSPNRRLDEKEVAYLKEHQPIGCRDEYNARCLRQSGLDAFLAGCMTMTLPQREPLGKQDKVFLVDAPDSLLPFIPNELLQEAVLLTQLVRVKSTSATLRITDEEAARFHQQAEERLALFRDEAALVITGRLHVATPCAAMGIPVILARNYVDTRFQFIDRFLPLYTPNRFGEIDWSPKTMIPQEVKQEIIETCGTMIRLAQSRYRLQHIYAPSDQKIRYRNNAQAVVEKLPIDREKHFSYAIMGVALESSYQLHEAMQEHFKNAKIVCAIDTYVTGMFLDDVPIIPTDDIAEKISEDILLLVTVARDAMKEKYAGKYPLALVSGSTLRFIPKEVKE